MHNVEAAHLNFNKLYQSKIYRYMKPASRRRFRAHLYKFVMSESARSFLQIVPTSVERITTLCTHTMLLLFQRRCGPDVIIHLFIYLLIQVTYYSRQQQLSPIQHLFVQVQPRNDNRPRHYINVFFHLC